MFPSNLDEVSMDGQPAALGVSGDACKNYLTECGGN